MCGDDRINEKVVSMILLALLAMIYLLMTYLQIGDILGGHLPQ